ncbi:putative membrane protein [Bacillus cereus 03BB102]|uniref:Putative membrane protein n=1 Tax=Bacillus cereus (strain 03BB102) TaxID=572264 RepID=A0A158RLB9_BACC3|nr:putative membrane protein [Bacillus cereus 03BB102]AJG52914.1 putative membrane protein [Bacillus cereus 03BB102]
MGYYLPINTIKKTIHVKIRTLFFYSLLIWYALIPLSKNLFSTLMILLFSFLGIYFIYVIISLFSRNWLLGTWFIVLILTVCIYLGTDNNLISEINGKLISVFLSFLSLYMAFWDFTNLNKHVMSRKLVQWIMGLLLFYVYTMLFCKLKLKISFPLYFDPATNYNTDYLTWLSIIIYFLTMEYKKIK